LYNLLNDEAIFKCRTSNLAYYLACNNSFFENAFTDLCKIQEALEGCAKQKEYLQLQLKCTEAEAEKSFVFKKECLLYA